MKNRFDRHVDELRKHAALIKNLSQMPERASAKDFQDTTDLLTKAAGALEELMRARPEGCVCDLIDGRCLHYAESCVHHGHLHVLVEALKAEYAKLEKTLKDETRLKLIAGALAGPAGLEPKHALAKQAIALADEVMKQLTDAP